MLNLLFASTSAGANRSYYGSSYNPAIQALRTLESMDTTVSSCIGPRHGIRGTKSWVYLGLNLASGMMEDRCPEGGYWDGDDSVWYQFGSKAKRHV